MLPDISAINRDTLVIFDDLMLDKRALQKAEEFFTRGRPMGINIVFISQSYYEVPRRTIRENCNFLILFRQNKRSLDALYRDLVDPDMDKKDFERFASHCFKKKHGYMVIDKTRASDFGRYRDHLKNAYIPDNVA